MSTVSRSQVEDAIGQVYDPCSVRADAPLSLIDMGLITGLVIEDDGVVRVTIRPTSVWCTMTGSLMQGVEQTVGAVPGVREVIVDIDTVSPWSEEALTPAGRKKLDDVRARSRAAVPTRRQQWRERVPAKMEN